MKKLILSSILLLSSTITITGIHTASSRVNLWTHKLKHSLYLAQNNMMSESKYYQVIDPFIKMAEQRLDIPPILNKITKEEDVKLIYEYLSCLVEYNASYFNKNYVNASYNNDKLENRSKDLRKVIELIKVQWKMDTLNVAAEFERTKWIFEQANKEFFNKLPFYKRVVMKALN